MKVIKKQKVLHVVCLLFLKYTIRLPNKDDKRNSIGSIYFDLYCKWYKLSSEENKRIQFYQGYDQLHKI